MRYFLLYISLIALVGCGKGKNDGTSAEPAKASLIFPKKDELCNQGSVLSATQSIVKLQWAKASNAESYDVNVTNLLTSQTTTRSTNGTVLDVTLLRGTPYSWSVTSRSSGTSKAESEVWRFYNAGPGSISYAPFPAEAVYPSLGQEVAGATGKVALVWSAADVDNDLSHYDLYLGTSSTPPLFQRNLQASTLTDISITVGQTYYWKIVTYDSKGHTSDSATFIFIAK